MSLNISTFRRALHIEPARESADVHFHSGQHGRIYPCDVARCESPHFTVGEVALLGR
jgi:hypothetical protein